MTAINSIIYIGVFKKFESYNINSENECGVDSVHGKVRRKVDLNKARYELTAVMPAQYPTANIPEVALVGRSNVGKSTIINTLLNRRNLARVSSEPGKTRGINFYNIDDALYLVDLPGYGYAKVSKGKKIFWSDIIETYLGLRRELGMIVMLVDIRHAPSDEDKVMYDWILEHGLKHLLVATKMDKIPRGQVFNRLQEIKKVLGTKGDTVLIPYSSETKQGKDEIWKAINGGLNADPII
jgi:GTP-binding protein